jgi:aryl-alcohol dehydrogenase-like predicted oxidoreductase
MKSTYSSIRRKSTVFRNCDFRFIGGAVWHRGQRIRFGNAIEFWDGASDNTVEGCLFDNIYDSGVTHQGGEMKMGVIVGSPLQQGALARKFDEAINDPRVYWLSKPRREQFKALYKLVDEVGLSLPELGIRFVLSNPDVHCVLMGARSAAEVDRSAWGGFWVHL